MPDSDSSQLSDLARTPVAALEQSLIRKARQTGYVTYEEVDALYPGEDQYLDAMDVLVARLVEEGVALVPAARIRGLLQEVVATRELEAATPPKKDVRGPLDLVDLYEADIKRFRPLSHDQERWLFIAIECARMSPGEPELGQEPLSGLLEQFFLDSVFLAGREAAYLVGILGRTSDSRFASARAEQIARLIEEVQARRQAGLGVRDSVLSELIQQCPAKNHEYLYDLCVHMWPLPTSVLQLLQERVLANRSVRLQSRTINRHLGGHSQLRELAGHTRQRASTAKQRVIQHSLRLVTSLAWRYRDQGLAMMDLYQEGNIGLMRAVDRFDYRQGNRFSTYAWYWIRQHITRAIADQSRPIRVPIHVHEVLRKIDEPREELREGLGREPTTWELAERCELPEHEVRRALRREPRISSLDRLLCCADFPLAWLGPGIGFLQLRPCPVRQTAARRYMYGADDRDEDFEWPPCVSGDKPVEAVAAEQAVDYSMLTLGPVSGRESVVEQTDMRMLSDAVDDVLAELSTRQRLVIERRFGLMDGQRYTLEEVGRELGVTRERVRQLEEQGLRRLRVPKRRRRLRAYW